MRTMVERGCEPPGGWAEITGFGRERVRQVADFGTIAAEPER
jgi:hypothetical protein